MIHMIEQLKIIAHTLRHVKITQESMRQSEETIKACIFETANVLEINGLMEDLMNVSFLVRHSLEVLGICCMVYITPLVSH